MRTFKTNFQSSNAKEGTKYQYKIHTENLNFYKI